MLFPNAKFRIVHRGGNFFAVPLSATMAPIPLAEPDLALLHACIAGGEPEQVAAALISGELAKFMPAIPERRNVLHRIDQLRQAGLLGEKAPAEPPGDAEAISLANAGTGQWHCPDHRLRLSSHFALQASPAGFVAWSAADRRHYALGIHMVMMLCAFAQGRPPPEVLARAAAWAERAAAASAIGWLARAGLLVRDLGAAGAALAHARPVPDLVGTDAEDWRTLEPDGRIPVYFTPHMENHYPLALGMMFSAIQSHRDGALLERYQLLPISYLTPQEFVNGPYRKFGRGVWLFSDYMWSLEVNLQVSSAVKSHDAGNLCIHGGPSAPGYQQACTEFMTRNPSVDIVVHGEGEIAIVELLECLRSMGDGIIGADRAALQAVNGITYRGRTDSNDLVWTAPRVRMRDLDTVPSPYLAGVFDAYRGRVEAAIVESNRGCPFGCTFCDWGSATRQKVRKFDLDRVKQEIEWIGRRKIPVLWIADANFGMYDRDIELAQFIVATRQRLGYPREVVVNYTKNTNRRLIEIIRAFSAGGIISQGIISIQTTDEATLEVINRQNIKTEKYDELAEVFAEAQLPLSTDLMIGLPGITVDAWDRDLQRYFDADVAVKAYPTQLLPNSPMADPEYLQKYQIEVDDKDFVISCHSFDADQLRAMKAVYYAFEVADGYGLLRYVLRYLQWEHGVPALGFLHALLSAIGTDPERLPALTWIFRLFLTEKSMPGGWHGFYRDIRLFIIEHCGIEADSALDTVLAVNEAAMPDDSLAYPRDLQLAHDFPAYFVDRKAGGDSSARRLRDYPPGVFRVDDPDLLAHIDMNYLQYDSHQYFWELNSAIARPRSVSDVKDRLRASA